MKKAIISLVALVTLGACGVDGEPTKPTKSSTGGISMTGTAKIGIARR